MTLFNDSCCILLDKILARWLFECYGKYDWRDMQVENDTLHFYHK